MTQMNQNFNQPVQPIFNWLQPIQPGQMRCSGGSCQFVPMDSPRYQFGNIGQETEIWPVQIQPIYEWNRK